MSSMDMFCLECGTGNPGENRYCSNCAALMPSTAAMAAQKSLKVFETAGHDRVITETGAIEFVLPEESDSILWPPETVFVAALDSDAEKTAQEYPLPPDAEFEDDQADDVFEQSLSGVRIEDLAEPADDEDPIEKPEPISQTGFASASASNEQTGAADLPMSAPETFDSGPQPPEQIAVKSNAPTRGWGQMLIRAAGIMLSAIILFAAGVATGIWLIGFPQSKIPESTDVPVVVEQTREPSPPTGMAYVPGGEFLMGSNAGDSLSKPAHPVTVSPFFIDLTEVTNEAYLKFVTATSHDPPPGWENGLFLDGRRNFPITGITWYEAAEYAAWMGKRLPTEAEWEFAARGSDGRIYPWGNVWEPSLANTGDISKELRNVGSGGQSPFGLFDMSGNAWEWTASDARPYSGGKEFPWSRLRLKIIRGGNWQSGSTTASSVFRGYYGAAGERSYSSTGFRCVKNLAKE